MATEQWRPVVGYEDRYEVSSSGRVRSHRRTVRHMREDAVLTTFITAGYPSVGLYTGRRSASGRLEHRTRYVHDLVLRAFVGPPSTPDMECCHADDNKLNNDLTNLRWGTSLENKADMRRNGGHFNTKKDSCKRGHRFAGANVMSGAKPDYRRCRACTRAYNFCKNAERRGAPHPDWETYADELYYELMGEEPERLLEVR